MRTVHKPFLFLLKCWCIVALFLASAGKAKADHFVGSEFSYVYTGEPGIYLLRLRFYRDCGGIPVGASMPVYGYSPGCASSHQLFMLSLNYSEEISEVCPTQTTECSTPSNDNIPGVEVYEYTGIVNVSAISPTCTDWIFYFEGGARNAGIINLNDGISMSLSFYTEAKLFDVPFVANSSPVFASSPVPFVCVSDTVKYNLQATDPDGDSLSFSLVNALGMYSSAIPYTGNYSGAQPFGTIGINTFQTTINSQTGQLVFRPIITGSFVLVFQVEEWRNLNGQFFLVGTMRRDVQVQVVNCSSPAPEILPLTLSQNGNQIAVFDPGQIQTLEACVPYCITIPVLSGSSDSSSQYSLLLTSNADAEVPGSVFTVTGQNTQNPIGQLCFEPDPFLDGKLFSFTIVAEDNACPFTNEISQAIQLKVVKSTGLRVSAPPASICAGASVQLTAESVPGKLPLNNAAYVNFSWQAFNLQGQLINGHFQGNNTTTLFPVVSPSQTTRYVLSANTSFGCLDTASVVVHVKGIQPNIQSISALSNVLCINQTSVITPVVNAPANVNFPVNWSASWTPGLGLSDPASFQPSVSYAGQNPITYSVIVSNGACADTGSVTISFVPDDIEVDASFEPAEICVGQSVQLSALATGQGAAGCSYSWVYGDRITDPGMANSAAAPANLGQAAYVVKVTTLAGCVVTDTVTVLVNGALPVINPFPDGGFVFCTGQTGQLLPVVSFDSVLTTAQAAYTWSPALGLNDISILNPSVTFAGQNSLNYTLTVSSGACSAIDSVLVNFVTAISVSATADKPIACVGDSIFLEAVVLPAGVQNPEYLWSGAGLIGQSSPGVAALPATTGTHQFVVSASLGNNCQTSDSVTVQVTGIRPIINQLIANPDTICAEHEAALAASVTSVSGAFPPDGFMYSWAEKSKTQVVPGESDSVLWVAPVASTLYFFQASDNGNCAVTDSVLVVVEEELQATFSSAFASGNIIAAPVTASFSNTTDQPADLQNISWEIKNLATGNIQNFSNEEAISYTFEQNGKYQITMRLLTKTGCEYEASNVISIGANLVPNIITPNNDGQNDAFFIAGLPAGAKVQIVNRWGNVIAEFGATESWLPGTETPSGIYFYSITADHAGEPQKGWLEVVR